MKWVLILVLLILTVLSAPAQAWNTTLGVYFEPPPSGKMHFDPLLNHVYTAYLYGHNINCYITAVEYTLVMHPSLLIINISYPPEYQIHLGTPTTGHSITYWPPMNGFEPGYNLLATYDIYAMEGCVWFGGYLVDELLVITPHPTGGRIAGTCYPDNAIFDFIGLTSIACPELIAVEEESWGAIKALFK